MMHSVIRYLAVAGCFVLAAGHTYRMGECPVVQPMSNFQMNRFLGVWYVVQKTSTASKCISYNYTRGDEPGEYLLTQDSNHPVLGLTPLKHQYRYTGELSVPEPSTPARMQVRFPLSVAGSASHVVFDTDYENYAGIFTCQKLAFAHRQSATLLSRRRDLEPEYLNQLRARLNSYGVDPHDLSIISQNGCPHGNNSLDINVDPNTFTAENFGNAVRKVGEKIGDGVEWVASAGSKAYHKLTGSEEKAEQNDNSSKERHETNQVDWFP